MAKAHAEWLAQLTPRRRRGLRALMSDGAPSTPVEPPPPVEASTRITESGDRRITEAGDVRVTE